MRLDRTTLFAGVPVLEAREALRRVGPWGFTQGAFARALRTSGDRDAVFREMVARGFISREPERHDNETYWARTDAGNAFCMAAVRTITRKTAERLVGELLGRIEVLDRPASPYLYRVKTLDVFGSYTRDTKDLGDVDLVLVLEAKEPNRDKQHALAQERIRQAMKAGRRFSNLVDELSWPETEVRQYLRAKSGFLRFHRPEDGVLEHVKLVRLWPLQDGGPRPLAPRTRSPGPLAVTPIQFVALHALAVGEDPIVALSTAFHERSQRAPFNDPSSPRTSVWPTIHSLLRRGLLEERPGRHELIPEYALTSAGLKLLTSACSNGSARRHIDAIHGGCADAEVRVRAALVLLEKALRPNAHGERAVRNRAVPKPRPRRR